MIAIIQLFISVVCCIPRSIYWWLIDLYHYFKEKWWLLFEGWGLHIYVGKFGSGKMCTMVHDAYKIAKKYPQVTIVTNFQLMNFPAHTNILPLNTPQDIINAPQNTLVLIDEIGTIFNSRDFASSKVSVPKILFQHVCQCRKRRLMIYSTTQRWNFLDKQLRDIAATVRVCRIHFGHPFSRLGTVMKYDAAEYDKAFTNPMIPLLPISGTAYTQTNNDRNRYDTAELVQNMLTSEYISDAEILANRGEAACNITELSKDSKKAVKRTSRKL